MISPGVRTVPSNAAKALHHSDIGFSRRVCARVREEAAGISDRRREQPELCEKRHHVSNIATFTSALRATAPRKK